MPRLLRRTLRVLLGGLLSLVVFAAIAVAGVSASMGESYVSKAGAPWRWPAPRAVPEGRIGVAVVVGEEGSVSADVLVPYEVFARSERFFVYTVAERRQASPLSGGARLLPEHTLSEVGTAALPEPDVVVVPAVVQPTGVAEAPLREWIARRAARGARVLGVCAGSELLAAAGLLNGREATSFWSNIDRLSRDYPRVRWQRGRRYVQDGGVTTTAGITSGTVGALRLVEELAGRAEAERVGADLAYPGWRLDGPTEIPVNRLAAADLPYGLNIAFPWLRPTVAIGLADGVGEIDVAAAFEVYSGVSSAYRTVPVAAGSGVTTRHGLVLLAEPVTGDTGGYGADRFVVPGLERDDDVPEPLRRWAARQRLAVRLPGGGRTGEEFGFDPMLRDLAEHADRATARTTAKFSEYPDRHLRLSGAAWPYRSTALALAALALSVAAGPVATAVYRMARRRGGRGLRRPLPPEKARPQGKAGLREAGSKAHGEGGAGWLGGA
ncbi:hypothetical protein GCM10017673_28980 [Streptosporangium violaceochromogenes]|nr:hypothetical protein GCM10017673_28980 [Streptosporangium violaceochromogenes]